LSIIVFVIILSYLPSPFSNAARAIMRLINTLYIFAEVNIFNYDFEPERSKDCLRAKVDTDYYNGKVMFTAYIHHYIKPLSSIQGLSPLE
jgi:hypothetical protein